jgi:membrane-associated phospholipid phosphatase
MTGERSRISGGCRTVLSRPTLADDTAAPPRGIRRWSGWVEVGVLFALYEAFEWVRARLQGAPGPSFRHASQVIHLEQLVGIFQEARIQGWFIGNHKIIEFFDIWYGSIHFVIPPLALFLLYRRRPAGYRPRRDALIILSLVALAWFWLWSLAPPRLLPTHYHFVDTAKTIGGMGPADKGSMADDNAYAAMPSLHIAWAAWCTVVLVPILRSWWGKSLAVLYPFVTMLAVVVTANHFILDGVGGLLCLAIGWVIAFAIDRRFRPLPSAAAARVLAASRAR